MKHGMTIKEAAHEWVREMNAIPRSVAEKLMSIDEDDIYEVTEPAVGDRVYCYQPLSERCGEIEDIYEDGRYHIRLTMIHIQTLTAMTSLSSEIAGCPCGGRCGRLMISAMTGG